MILAVCLSPEDPELFVLHMETCAAVHAGTASCFMLMAEQEVNDTQEDASESLQRLPAGNET